MPALSPKVWHLVLVMAARRLALAVSWGLEVEVEVNVLLYENQRR